MLTELITAKQSLNSEQEIVDYKKRATRLGCSFLFICNEFTLPGLQAL
jgi:hypothetical protein